MAALELCPVNLEKEFWEGPELFMPMLKNRLASVYLELGKILNEPQSFGLGERAPEALIEALMGVSQTVKSEMADETASSIDSLCKPPQRRFVSRKRSSSSLREGNRGTIWR